MNTAPNDTLNRSREPRTKHLELPVCPPGPDLDRIAQYLWAVIGVASGALASSDPAEIAAGLRILGRDLPRGLAALRKRIVLSPGRGQ